MLHCCLPASSDMQSTETVYPFVRGRYSLGDIAHASIQNNRQPLSNVASARIDAKQKVSKDLVVIIATSRWDSIQGYQGKSVPQKSKCEGLGLVGVLVCYWCSRHSDKFTQSACRLTGSELCNTLSSTIGALSILHVPILSGMICLSGSYGDMDRPYA